MGRSEAGSRADQLTRRRPGLRIHGMTDPAALIREMLAHAGMSQSELARRLGVLPHHVSRWATGAVVPGGDVVLRIAELCGYTLRRSDDGKAG